MSDLILVETVDNVISNINEDENTKSYNIDYDINDRLRFLQEKYKDCEIKINRGNSKLITCKKKNSKRFRECCINFDCIKQPSFCIEGQTKATHCKACSILSDKEMIDIGHKNSKCIICKKKCALFCKVGETKPTHCKHCSLEVEEKENIEMVDIYAKNSKCIVCNQTIAGFCKIGETKPTHCKHCSLEVEEKENIEMVDIYAKNKKCIKCNNIRASFCKIGETKPTHCKDCSLEVEEKENIEMIDIKSKKCIVCKKIQASFRKIGETIATHCYLCSQIVSIEENIDMISTEKRICKNIINGIQCKTMAVLKKYDGYCFKCYFKINPTKIPSRNIKIKEDAIVDFIKLIYTQEIRAKYKIINIIYDKSVGKTKKCPDIVIICETYVIVIEVDEFQHKKDSQKGSHYSKENEDNKMNLIKDYYKSIDKKTIYIRFNPDDYLSKDNIKIKSPWKKNDDGVLVLVDETDWKNRLEILKKKIDFYLKKKEIKKNWTNYLFYDGYKN
jgi:hypothetical protein